MIRIPPLVARRIASTLVVLGVGAGVVAIDARDRGPREGASAAIDVFAGFPQASSSGRISTSWFCPGVAAGDGVEAANVVIVNPADEQISATMRLLSGEPAPLERIVVEPRSRLEVDVLRGRTVGIVVPVIELVGPVGTVEQELFYAAGDVTSQCVSQTSSRWYFADGFTAEGSTHRLVVANPYPESAVVSVVFTTADGERSPAQLQGLILAPLSARSIPLVDQGARDEKRLAVTVRATSGQVLASRMQHYLGAGRLGYSTTMGTPATGRQWWFTSGRTGPLVTEELVVHNPSDEPSKVTVSFFGEGITNGAPVDSPGATPSAAVEVPPGGVVGIDTNVIADLPKGDHAMVVDVVDGPGVVVEHVLSQKTDTGYFTAVTNGIPEGLASTLWRVPSGLARGARNALTILNTTAEAGTFSIAAVGPGGEVALPGAENVAIDGASLSLLDVPEGAANGEVVIRSSVPLVIQRRTARGHGLPGFGIVGALPVRGRVQR